MLKIGEIIKVKIEKIAFGGEGIAYHNELVIFVPMSCIGDVLEVRIISLKKTYARALIEKILIPSNDRISLDKISFEDYSGCDFAMLKYDKQLEYKSLMLLDMFEKIIGENLKNRYLGIEGANNITNYRNKVAEPFFYNNGSIDTGFYEKKSHKVFSAKEDILKSKIAIDITKIVLNKFNEYGFSIFNEKTNKGFLKHLVIRNNNKNEVMLIIVCYKKSEIAKLKNALEEVIKESSNIISCYISIKNKIDNVILGDEYIHISGKQYIEEKIFNLNFKIYPDSFFQVNIEQVNKLYSKALAYIKTDNEMIIDAFSGTGTIAMLMSKNAKKVYAIESVKSAILSGRKVAKENGIKNINFICAKVEDKIKNIVSNEDIRYIVLDPPRKGVEKSALIEIAKNNIDNIIYISCEPSTFARDYNILKEYGYTINQISAVDMFPQTHHIETVALITKEK